MINLEKFAANGAAAQRAVDDLTAGEDRTDESISFTVPASGRRYTIWLDDWESISEHLIVAASAVKVVKDNTPETKT